jgi:hypothetical protein
VQNLIELPEFGYGYPSPNPEWFGLWSPVLDCFLLVDDNFIYLKKTQALAFSKMLTVLVKLDKKLYKNNVIDNSCASAWTLLGPDTINFYSQCGLSFPEKIIENLQPSMIDNFAEVNQIQSWFMFIMFWIKKIETINDPTVSLANFAFDGNLKGTVQQQIYHTLMVENNLDLARIRINEILQIND